LRERLNSRGRESGLSQGRYGKKPDRGLFNSIGKWKRKGGKKKKKG